jgi:hypothetical protein
MVEEVKSISKSIAKRWYAPEPLWARITRRGIFILGVINEAGLIDFYHLLVGAGIEIPKHLLVIILGLGYFATKFAKINKQPTETNIQPNEDGSNLN